MFRRQEEAEKIAFQEGVEYRSAEVLLHNLNGICRGLRGAVRLLVHGSHFFD